MGGRVLLFSLAENSCHVPWVGTAAARAALPVPISTVCVVLCCLCCVSKQWCLSLSLNGLLKKAVGPCQLW